MMDEPHFPDPELTPGDLSTSSSQTLSIDSPSGQITITLQADLPPETRLNLEIESLPSSSHKARLFFLQPAAGFSDSWCRIQSHLPEVLFCVALLIYLTVRLIGLEKFPIYFFTDEAVQRVLADDFLQDGFKSYTGEILPTYFVNGDQYNLSLSVYLQLLPALLFDRTIFVTRLVSVLVSLLGVMFVGLTMKNIFQMRHAWIAVLLLSLTPAWFLHSRTAFETVLATSFYAGFLYAYLMYRLKSPRYFYLAVVMAGLVFYSYSPAQMVIGLTIILLLISDWRYHWQNRFLLLKAVGIGLILLIPYARFLINHPGENTKHLQILYSYWVQNIPFSQKLGIYFKEYLKGLNPLYWFLPNNVDFVRHLMKGYGHLWRPMLPFFLIGLGTAIYKIRQPAYRAVLIAFIAAPSGAALAQLGITRALVMVIPAVLLGTLGLHQMISWFKNNKIVQNGLITAAFLCLLIGNISMLNDALTRGPVWFDDYGLAGMQYGARELTQEINDYLALQPDTKIVLTPSWTNGTNVVMRFFFEDPTPFALGSIDGWMTQKQELTDQQLFIMLPEEYQRVLDSHKFKDIQVEKILSYPNGSPGFYFVRLAYVDQIDAILDAEKEARKALVKEQIELNGESWQVQHSVLDMGKIEDIFDGDSYTLIRSMEANPLRVNVEYPTAKPFSTCTIEIGGIASRINLRVYAEGKNEPVILSDELPAASEQREIVFDFDPLLNVTRMELELLNVNDQEPAHVHLWEFQCH